MNKIIFFFLLLTGFTYAQQAVNPNLRNPNRTIYTHLYFLQAESYNASKAAITIRGIPKKEAIDKVIKIKEIFDGKGLIVDFKNIPTDPNYLDTISSILANELEKPQHRFIPFPDRMPGIYVEKIGTRWYYSKETVESIDKIYKETFPWEFTWLQKKFPILFEEEVKGVHIWKPIGILTLIAFAFLLFYILKPLILYILKISQKLIISDKTYEKSSGLLYEISRILVLIIILAFIEYILPSLQLFKINSFLFLGLNVAQTIFWVYFFVKLVKLIIMYYGDFSKKTHSRLNEQLAPILNKLLLYFIVFIGFLHILTLFGVNPTTVIAGASIGGVAVAFAAQDSVKNLIGTLNIFLDEPFRLGDWVVIGGVEGMVEKVGMRSTRVRAADTSIFQIPNSKVSEMEINNKGLRMFRRYKTELGIRYDTPPVLIEAFVQGIRKIIIEHPDTRSDSYNVEFTSFGDSSLKIMVNVFFKKLDWGDEQSSRHRLHMAIVKLAAALGVEFAFPSSTLMIEQLPGQESLVTTYDTDLKNIDKNVQKVLDDFKGIDHKADPNVSSIPE